MATHSSILAWKNSMDKGSLVGYSPKGCKEPDTIEHTHTHHKIFNWPAFGGHWYWVQFLSCCGEYAVNTLINSSYCTCWIYSFRINPRRVELLCLIVWSHIENCITHEHTVPKTSQLCILLLDQEWNISSPQKLSHALFKLLPRQGQLLS